MKSEHGMAYITVLVIIMILSSLAISYSYMSAIEAEISYNKKDADQAYYIAEAGLRKGIWRLLHSPLFKDIYNNVLINENFGAGTFGYMVTKANFNPSVLVTSNGAVGNTKRTVKTRTYIRIIIITIAGNNTAGDTTGNPLTSMLRNPESVAVDSAGNVYIADTGNHRIKKLVWNSGTKTYTSLANFAGTGAAGDTGNNGAATSGKINAPRGVAVDSTGNVYIADTNSNRIKKVDVSTNIITFIAGTGTAGYAGDGGLATSARLRQPEGVAVTSSGQIYVADTQNSRVRRFTVGGNITLFAGNGTAGYAGDGGLATAARINKPNSVMIDSSGNVYISDTLNHRIRKVASGTNIITTVAGNGTAGFSGDGGAATSARINTPKGIVLDPSGSFLIGDNMNSKLRLVLGATGIISSYAGTGTVGYSGDGGPPIYALFSYPYGVAMDNFGNIYIADRNNHVIRKIMVQ